MSLSLCKTDLNRLSPFGFSCGRCISCCRYKKIQLNPYEIARLARNRGLSAAGFIDRCTTNGGTVLASREDGTCVFLGRDGCTVHTDRPLVCRLYPLGRLVPFQGTESFSCLEPEEGCRGNMNENGTIAQYLEEQGAAPFLHAADLYLDLLWRLLEVLKDRDMDPSQSHAVLDTVRSVAGSASGGHDLSWIDMDRAVEDYCRLKGMAVPDDIEEKMALHIKAVREWVE